MDREQIAQQILAQRQTTKQLGFLLMGLIVLLVGLASGGGYLMYSSLKDSGNGSSVVSGQTPSTDADPSTGQDTIPDGTDIADAGTSNDSDDNYPADDDGFDGLDTSSPDSDSLSEDGQSDDSSDTDSSNTSGSSDDSDDDMSGFDDSSDSDNDDSSFDNMESFDDTQSGDNKTPPTSDSGQNTPKPVTVAPKPTPASSNGETVSFKIVSKPSMAKVFLGKDGKYLGKTPLEVKLPQGEQLLTFVKLDHKKVSQKVLVGVQKKTWVMLPSLEKKVVKKVERAPVPTSAPIAGDTPPEGLVIPPGMVYVNGGYFLRGAGSGPEDARPKTKIKVSPFFISRTEVTVAEYNRFLVANRLSKKRYRTDEGSKKDYKYRDPYGKLPSDYFTNPKYQDYPVVNVDWFDAYAYARWKGYRLPTEAEWELASRGTRSSVYPWGMKSTGKEANWEFKGNIYSATAPVRTFLRDKSDFGAYDMAGNVREWVYDWYGKHYYAESPKVNPKGPKSGQFKVIKGGSWNTSSTALYNRGYSLRRGKFNDCGFRCAIYVKD